MLRMPRRCTPYVVLSALLLVACAQKQVESVAPPAASCPQTQTPPEPVLPWSSAAALCEQAERGQSWAGATPPLGPNWVQSSDDYALSVRGFLRDLSYRKAPYAWLHDANWRMTGPFQGCAPDGVNQGPHPAVRIYYSPEVIDWM